MKKPIGLLVILILLCCVSACRGKDTSSKLPDFNNGGIKQSSKEKKSIADNTLKFFVFESGEAVENLSDEDFLYIVENYQYYSASDFIDDIEEKKIDLFDVPLVEWEEDGTNYQESVSTLVPDFRYPINTVNLDERIPEEELKEFTEADCRHLIDSQNRWHQDSGTGTRTDEGEIIFCGEDDNWLEYSVRFTEYRTYFNNDRLITKEIQRNYRRIYDKNRITVSNGDSLYPVYLGEYTLDKMKEDSDFFLSNGEVYFYREFDESDEEISEIYYTMGYCYGDYGLCDTARLVKETIIYDKTTHTSTARSEKIKELDVPGTYHEWY